MIEQPEIDLGLGWVTNLRCGHQLPADDGHGHMYGQLKPGDWIGCPKCQGQGLVTEVIPRASPAACANRSKR